MNVSKVIDAVSLARDPEQTSGMLTEVLARVQDLKDVYPQFESWLADRVLPGLRTGDRSILVEYRHGELAGLAILKDDGSEKKICCLRVLPGFQDRHGLGVRLFEKAFNQLDSRNPLLSVAEERLPAFRRIFDHFGFELAETHKGLYRADRTEFVFNGTLFAPKGDFSIRGANTSKFHDWERRC
ncbi:hypothetical protein R69927_00432 [Paraburkholderia domus]|nr:hypothetical protein R69927_00432 [Paraburkholderia domus]